MIHKLHIELQKDVMRSTQDIYVFVTITRLIFLLLDKAT